MSDDRGAEFGRRFDELTREAARDPGAGPGPPSMDGAGSAPEERGELLLARRFVELRGDAFLYARGLGWLSWTGAAWRPCELGEEVEAMKVVAATMGEKDRPRSARALLGALRLVESDPRVAVLARSLDAEPYLLGTPGGLVNLRTGALAAARPEHLVSRLTACAPVAADAPRWTAFLERVQPDEDQRAYLRRLVGLALVGEVLEPVLPVFHGSGFNGKTVFVSVIAAVLGDYAHTAPLDLVMASDRRSGQASPELADLRGRRLVSVAETAEDRRLAVERVKVLTGGDTISARQLYGRPFTFRPSHTVLLVTNHRPRVGDEGDAVWGRLALVPWTETIPERERMKGLAGQLVRDEGGAILAWAIAGAVEYLRAGLGTPDTVVEATRDYRDREDHFGAWLADCADEHEAATVRSGELMASYRNWALLNGAPPLTDAALRERLERRGFTRVARSGRVSWLGLRLPGGDR